MKCRVIIVVGLLFSVGIISGIPQSQERNVPVSPLRFQIAQYTPHSEIMVDRNSQFAAQGFSGSGTVADPYVLEYVNISSGFGTGILIRNTSAHFMIRYSVISAMSYGMYMNAVANGSIQNCSIRAEQSGIELQNCTSMAIIGSEIIGAENGVGLIGVNESRVEHCRIHYNDIGLSVSRSQKINITYSTIYENFGYGIYVDETAGGIYVFSNSIGWNGEYSNYALHLTRNALDDSATERGRSDEWLANRWSDFNGNAPYTIPGLISKNDSLPALLTDAIAPSVSGSEDARIYEGESGSRIYWNSSDEYMCSYRVYLDGSQVKAAYWSGGQLTLSLDGLTIGSHNYTAVFFDCAGNKAAYQIWASILLDIFGEGTVLIFYSSVVSIAVVVMMLIIMKRIR
jgi:hypothetical protein